MKDQKMKKKKTIESMKINRSFSDLIYLFANNDIILY